MTDLTRSTGPPVPWHAAQPPGSRALTLDEVLDRWDALGGRVRRSGNGWSGLCPLHDDHHPSADVHEGDDGRVLFTCQVCSSGDVDGTFRRFMDLLNGREVITAERLVKARTRRTNRRSDVWQPTGTVHVYHDADGRPVARKVRGTLTDGETGKSHRSFRWERATPANHGDGIVWLSGLADVQVPLLDLPALRAGIDAGHDEWLAEGESDCAALQALRYVATTTPHGACVTVAKIDPRWVEQLKGAPRVHVTMDSDQAGQQHGENWRTVLEQAGIPVTVWSTPYAKDIREHLQSGRTINELEMVPAPAKGSTTVDGSPSGRALVLTSATQYTPRAVEWLENDRIPAGAVTLLGGREGIGKSLIADDFAARLTRGTLPGCRLGRPSRVLIATSEDAWEYTVVPRLMAADADLSLIERLQVADRGTLVGLSTPVDVPALRTYLDTHRDVAAVIFDPLTSVMDGKLDAHRDREVREALEPLAEVAAESGCAVLGLVHLNKSSGTDPVNAVLGSRAFGAVARVVLIAARDPEDGSCVLSLEKSNLGRLDMPAQGYRIDSATVSTPDGSVSTGRLVWTGVTDRRVRDLMADQPDDRAARDEAKDWLKSRLGDAPDGLPAADVIKLAEKDGISRDTLKRAKKAAGVVSRKAGMDDGWVWALGTSQAPDNKKDGSEGSTDTSKGAEGSREQSPAPFAPFVLPSGEPDEEEQRDDALMAKPPVCDFEGCGATEGVFRYFEPYWVIRCPPHRPNRSSTPEPAVTHE